MTDTTWKLQKIDEVVEWEVDVEIHSVPFGAGLPVVAFADPELRRTVAKYWNPELRCVDDEEGEKDTALCRLLEDVSMLGEGEALQIEHQKMWSDVRVRVRVVLSYPLNDTWCVDVEIPPNEIGRIFSIAHDMYTTLYELDAEGHNGIAPRAAPGLANRAEGSHVWGHDMTDLFFEEVYFVPDPSAVPLDRRASYAHAVPLGTFSFAIGS